MRLLYPVIVMLVLLTLMGCSPDNSREQNSSAAPHQAQLDLSRTDAVKNTPSRQGTSSPEPASVAVATTERNEPLITELPPGTEVPAGMVFVPGGTLDMGADDGLPRERPVHQRRVQAFFMDEHPVTVGQFRAFIEATGYRTQAEKFGDAAVFDLKARRWYLQVGATWEYPRGQAAGPAPDDHPVTQVSWHDAQAYCQWAGRRLPTEAEWEHAARNGQNTRDRYFWGHDIMDEAGNYRANIWQGSFPAHNSGIDGYLFTSPVGEFGANELGLTDLSGNVWEWCQDWYKSYDPQRPGQVQTAEPERVMRGGSFMCDPSYCHGYRVSGRSGSTPETGLFHVGFRTVRDL